MDINDCCCRQPDPWVDDLRRSLCFSCMGSLHQARYRYEPLCSASGIRLLRLFPGQREDELRCEVFQIDLDSKPEYEAVSYTWGDPLLCGRVQHWNADTLAVTKNCENALRDLRSSSRERILWIDAICIDQADNYERGHQVRLMQRVYAQAKRVIIYLGPTCTEEISQALDFFPSLKAEAAQDIQPGISALVSLPWFTRVWVLQEVACARKAIIVIGPHVLDWQYLSIGSLTQRGLSAINSTGFTPAVLRFAHGNSKPLNDDITLLNTARICLSSDPRDKIYALLGLLNFRTNLEIVPNYDEPVEDLYTHITRQMIQKACHLDILSEIGKEVKPEKEVKDIQTQLRVSEGLATTARRELGQDYKCHDARDTIIDDLQYCFSIPFSWTISVDRVLTDPRYRTNYRASVRGSHFDDHWLYSVFSLPEHDMQRSLLRLGARLAPELGIENSSGMVLMFRLEDLKELAVSLRTSPLWGTFESCWPGLHRGGNIPAIQAIYECSETNPGLEEDFESPKWWESYQALQRFAFYFESSSRIIWRSVRECLKEPHDFELHRKIDGIEYDYSVEFQEYQARVKNITIKYVSRTGFPLRSRRLDFRGPLTRPQYSAFFQMPTEKGRKCKEREFSENVIEEKIHLLFCQCVALAEFSLVEKHVWALVDDVRIRKTPLEKERTHVDNKGGVLKALEENTMPYLSHGFFSSPAWLVDEPVDSGANLYLPSRVPDLSRPAILSSLDVWRPNISINEAGVAEVVSRSSSSRSTALKIRALKMERLSAPKAEKTRPCGLRDIHTTNGGISLAVRTNGIDLFWKDFMKSFEATRHGATMEAIRKFCNGRKIGMTENSFAICPSDTRSGDAIYLTYGSYVPFVLRPTDSPDGQGFKLIGECYLHGLRGPKSVVGNDYNYMDLLGEFSTFFEAKSTEELPWQTIYLE